jgi:hypothetical protein
MMYGELYQYFALHKQLNVPGVGTFLLERRPAISDFPNKLILPPTYAISLNTGSGNPSRHFFNWLAAALRISDREAVIRFNDFAFDLKKQLSSGNSIEWKGIGVLKKEAGQDLVFDPSVKDFTYESPVPARKVIRENAEHTIRVGEDERSSVEMIEYLHHEEPKKNYWWALALALGIIITIFIGWFFSEHGLKPSSTANNQKVESMTAPTTYKLLN